MPATFAPKTTREGLFASTRWTMILDAGESQTPPDQALSALSELCRIYWRPIFLFLRRQGSNPDDAQDLTQGFFAHLIESRAYARADPEKGDPGLPARACPGPAPRRPGEDDYPAGCP